MPTCFTRYAARLARRACLVAAAALLALPAQAVVKYSNAYRSPRNPEREIRKSTTLIVLHTTEAPARSSLNKLSERGEAHYCVVENGTVYRIIDRDREAYHAGRSMWNGKRNVDEFSVGIEVVGYHDRQMPLVQLSALRELVVELKALYGVDDAHVLCHSHVAYGAPNKWHARSHRGRKQCGMLFAMPSVRAKLGLAKRPSYDPDIRAKRLVQADKYLDSVLYGGTDLFQGVYGSGRVTGVSPTAPSSEKPKPRGESPLDALAELLGGLGGGTAVKSDPQPPKPAIGPAPASGKTAAAGGKKPAAAKPQAAGGKPAAQTPPAAPAPDAPFRKGARIENGRRVETPAPAPAAQPAAPAQPPAPVHEDPPDGVRILGTHGKTLYEIAGNEAASPNVIVVRPDGTFSRGSELSRAALARLPVGTKVLVGYAVGGPVSTENGPARICGSAWRAPTTYYLIRRDLVPGDKVDDRRIAPGTYVFFVK